ncbi:MAG TPA: response regulator transcription factor [Rhodocyclaceae bacterium]|nr:response regulator transcription factor [Rhodocyclaceae bacterium]
MSRNTGSNRIEICVVEDDEDLREELVAALQSNGFGVRGFPGSRELYADLLIAPCNIVILDIGLPGEDGFSIAQRIHALGGIGTIILSARDSVADRVRALSDGVDCYLVKPVVMEELLAVIEGMKRRLPLHPASHPAKRTGHSWTLASDGWTLLDPKGKGLSLTEQERAFVGCLWKSVGHPVSREDLAAAMDDNPYEYDFHRFETLVSRLRQKAKSLDMALPVRAVRGKGYMFLSQHEPL